MGALIQLFIRLAITAQILLFAAVAWLVKFLFLVTFRFFGWRRETKLRTLTGYQFKGIERDSIIVLSKRAKEFRASLAYVDLPHKEAPLYKDAVKFIQDSLAKAKALEVEFRTTDFVFDGLFYPSEIFIGDRSFNVTCLESGLFQNERVNNGVVIPKRFARALKKAESQKIGIHAPDPLNNTEEIEWRKSQERRRKQQRDRAERLGLDVAPEVDPQIIEERLQRVKAIVASHQSK